MLILDLDATDRRQLSLALDLLARRMRVDGLLPTSGLQALADVLRRSDWSRLEPTNQPVEAAGVESGPMVYDIDEVAQRLRLSPRQVERLISDGDLKSLLIGRARRVRPDDLAEFIAATGRSAGAGHVASARAGTAAKGAA